MSRICFSDGTATLAQTHAGRVRSSPEQHHREPHQQAVGLHIAAFPNMCINTLNSDTLALTLGTPPDPSPGALKSLSVRGRLFPISHTESERIMASLVGKVVKTHRASVNAETSAVFHKENHVSRPHQSNRRAGVVTAAVADHPLAETEPLAYTLQ